MIVAAALCPQPPALLPGVTGSPVPEVEQLRDACTAALARLAAMRLDRLVVVAAAGPPAAASGGLQLSEVATARWAPTPHDRPGPGSPLGVAVARTLLTDPGLAALAGLPTETLVIASDLPTAECVALGVGLADSPNRVGVLAMGDGSARRGLKAPGYFDHRAAGFDDAVEKAWWAGDLAALIALDSGLAAELLVAGRAPWQFVAAALAARRAVGEGTAGPEVEMLYRHDPFGVRYLVAVITNR